MSEEKNKYKVVIADDEYVSRTLFEMLIKSSVTYELSASFSAAEQAVNYCRINQVDLVILDEKGPGWTHLRRNYKKK